MNVFIRKLYYNLSQRAMMICTHRALSKADRRSKGERDTTDQHWPFDLKLPKTLQLNGHTSDDGKNVTPANSHLRTVGVAAEVSAVHGGWQSGGDGQTGDVHGCSA